MSNARREDLDRLIDAVIIDAHDEAITAINTPGTTHAEATTVAVRAAFRTALANGLITPTPADAWPEWLHHPRPEDEE